MKKGTILIALIMTCLSVCAQSRFNGGEGGGYTSAMLDNIVMSSNSSHKQDQLLIIYPNPAINNVFLSVISEWVLLDETGRTVSKGKGNHINLTALKPGMYYIKSSNEVYPVCKLK